MYEWFIVGFARHFVHSDRERIAGLEGSYGANSKYLAHLFLTADGGQTFCEILQKNEKVYPATVKKNKITTTHWRPWNKNNVAAHLVLLFLSCSKKKNPELRCYQRDIQRTLTSWKFYKNAASWIWQTLLWRRRSCKNSQSYFLPRINIPLVLGSSAPQKRLSYGTSWK